MNSLIMRLLANHRLLNRELRRELARAAPDHFRIKRLKQERLATKDRIARHLPDAAELRRAARMLLARTRAART